jgi:hypothetical protein
MLNNKSLTDQNVTLGKTNVQDRFEKGLSD